MIEQIDTNESVDRRSISLFPDQWAVIDEVNDRFDFRNVSNALRYVLSEYRRLKEFEAIMRNTATDGQ
jgi:hypothetical protein